MSGEVCQIIWTSFSTYLKLIHYYIQVGTRALKGEEEYINVKLFEAVDHDRTITGRGKNIMIFDPKVDMSTPPYWEHDNPSENATSLVPIGHVVRVIGATVKFT